MRPPVYLAEAEPVEPLVGPKGVAEVLGVTARRARQLSRHTDFPPPVTHVGMSDLWYRADIEAWATANAERRARHSRKTA